MKREARTGAWLEHVTDQQAENDCDPGHGKEIDKALCSHPPQGALARTGYAYHHAGKHQRHDDHFHQFYKRIARRL